MTQDRTTMPLEVLEESPPCHQRECRRVPDSVPPLGSGYYRFPNGRQELQFPFLILPGALVHVARNEKRTMAIASVKTYHCLTRGETRLLI